MPDTTDRGQLAALIDKHSFQTPSYSEEAAGAVLAAGWRPPPRVITDVDELRGLPVGAVIIDREQIVLERGRTDYPDDRDWFETGSAKSFTAGWAELPATVLWLPSGDHA